MSLEQSLPSGGGGSEILANNTVPLEPQITFEPENAETQGWLGRAWRVGVNAVKATAITVEFLPVTNEGARYGAFAYAQTVTNDPVVGAAVLGGSTLLIEGASALAAADWVAQDKIKDVIDNVDTRLADTKFAFLSPKRYIPERMRVSPVAEAGLALTLGTLAVLEAKQREDPTRTAEQNMKRGLFTAGWLSGVFAIEGALISEGIDNYQNPSSVGVALLGLAGIAAFTRWAKKKVRNEE